MWIISAGRQTGAIVKAVEEYYKEQEVMELNMIENLLNITDKKGIEGLKDVTCIGVLDSGIKSLKDWRQVFQLTRKLKDIPFVIYSRYPNMTPKKGIFGDNVQIIVSENEIPIKDFAERMRITQKIS